MKVVCVLGKSPVPPNTGSRRRLLRLIEGLIRSGIDVTVVLLDFGMTESDIDALRTSPFRYRIVSVVQANGTRFGALLWLLRRRIPFSWSKYDLISLRSEVRSAIERERPALVWCASAILADMIELHRIPSPWLEYGAVPLVVDAAHTERESLDSQRAELLRAVRTRPSAIRQIAFLTLDRQSRIDSERRAFESATAVTVCSSKVGDDARLNGADAVISIPNGTDVPSSLGWNPNGDLLFIGSFGYKPNVDAARHLARVLLPVLRQSHQSLALRIVGPGASHVADLGSLSGVHIEGYVSNLGQVYDEAALVLAPLSSGSGTKTKVLEAMGYGVPVVTTSQGVAGLDIVAGHHVAVSDDDEGLIRESLNLLADVELARARRNAARAWVESNASWESIGDEFAQNMSTLDER